jgi:hypothetical protein
MTKKDVLFIGGLLVLFLDLTASTNGTNNLNQKNLILQKKIIKQFFTSIKKDGKI